MEDGLPAVRVCGLCPARIRVDNQSGLCQKCFGDRYREENREAIRQWHRDYNRLRPERIMLSKARQRARTKGLEFSITEHDIHIPPVCPMLGIEIRISDGKLTDGSPTLDRIDSAIGYRPDNIQVLSHKANRAKSNLTAAEMDTFCAAHLRERGFRVIETVGGLTCPRCSNEGPHDRLGATLDGSHVEVQCSDNLCQLIWKMTG